MTNIIMRESWVNATEGHRRGSSDWYESFTDDEGELFRSLQKELGRCTGKVYIDTDDGDARPVGWVFLKKTQYDDIGKYFLMESWVELQHRYLKGD